MNYFPSKAFTEYPKIYRLFYVFLCITALCLPFHKIFASYPLILAGFVGIIMILTSPDVKKMFTRIPVLVLCLLFITFLIGYYLSANRSVAWIDLRGKFYFLFYPLIFFAVRSMNRQLLNYILDLFIIACLVFICVSVGIAGYDFLVFGQKHFFYKELVAFSTIHPSYLGMYINFAIVLTAIRMFRNVEVFTHKSILFYIAVLIIFFIYLLMLTAKTAIFIAGISLVGIFIYWGRTTGQMRKAVLYLSIAFLIMTLIAISDQGMRTRIGMIFNYQDVNYDNSVLSRQYQWQSAIQLIKDSNWKGVGTAESADKLVEYYAKNNFQKGVDERYNTHNQYLQTLVEGGWLAFTLLLFVFVFTTWFALKQHNYIFLFFNCIFLVSILTECMFKTLSGIIFFNLFSPLLLASNRFAQA